MIHRADVAGQAPARIYSAIACVCCLSWSSAALAVTGSARNEGSGLSARPLVASSQVSELTPTLEATPTIAQASPLPAAAQAPDQQLLDPDRPNLQPLPETLPPRLPPLLNDPMPSPAEPAPETEARVLVKQITVLGNTVLSPADLDRVTAPFLGRSLTFEQLLDIRTAITNLYIERGYTTSGAFLPPQDLSDGVVEVQAVEGELEKVEIQGLTRLRQSYVRDRIALAAKPPINLRRLETALQLLQLDPLLTDVDAELKAGTSPGRSILSLKLREAATLSAALVLENRDSPSVGSVRESVSGSYTNLLGMGDRVNAEIGFTRGVQSYDFSYAIPLNARDGTLTLRYADSHSEIIEKPFSVLDINGETRTFSIGFRQPIQRSPSSELALGLTLDVRRSETFLFEDVPFSFSPGVDDGKSNVTVLRFSQDWVNRSPRQVFAARSQFSLGLDVLDATVNDNAPDGRFFSWVGQAQWVQALGGGMIAIARVATQLSTDPLLPLEQFSIGGIDTVRGYRQNQRVADNGAIGSIEVRVPIARGDRLGVIQLAPFFDIGTVWNNDGASPSPNTLISIGLGLRWQIGSAFSARLDWGIPLKQVDDQGDSLQDEGVVFSIRLQPF